MKLEQKSPEVFYAPQDSALLSYKQLQWLQEQAKTTKNHRARICVHGNEHSPVHEMFIAMTDQSYVRPHKHLTKDESCQIFKGEVVAVLFDDHGNVERFQELGDIQSGKDFYLRLRPSTWHCLLLLSDILVFKEVVAGPFDMDDCEFPEWAPDGSDPVAVKQFQEKLYEQYKNTKQGVK